MKHLEWPTEAQKTLALHLAENDRERRMVLGIEAISDALFATFTEEWGLNPKKVESK